MAIPLDGHLRQVVWGLEGVSRGPAAMALTGSPPATGLPAADPREAHAAGAHQQAVPAAGPREPHRHGQQAEADGARGQPALGQPPEAGHSHPAETPSNLLYVTGSFVDTGEVEGVGYVMSGL